jgi:predicted nuclease of restriction endonuclease-like (RecB) superfamily
MVTLHKYFPDENIFSTLSRQLTWSHFVEIIALPDSSQRQFYAEMCALDHWSVRTLREKMGKKLFERTVRVQDGWTQLKDSSRSPSQHEILHPHQLFQNPYILDFLNLP